MVPKFRNLLNYKKLSLFCGLSALFLCWAGMLEGPLPPPPKEKSFYLIDAYQCHMVNRCHRCAKVLVGMQRKWCSKKCNSSQLYDKNKRLYRKYMRKSQQVIDKCHMCAKVLVGKQNKWCSRKCRHKNQYDKKKEQYRKYMRGSQEKSYWKNLEKQRERIRKKNVKYRYKMPWYVEREKKNLKSR
jgi:hypothetical protein